MLYVKVPKEIREYEERVFIGMTIRQLIWGSAALVAGILWFLITDLALGLPQDVTIFGCIGISFPLFCCGWGSYQGMPINKYAKIWIRYYFRSNILHYDDEFSFYERSSKDEKKKISRKERRYNQRVNKTIKEADET